jgi:hypothetical protein
LIVALDFHTIEKRRIEAQQPWGTTVTRQEETAVICWSLNVTHNVHMTELRQTHIVVSAAGNRASPVAKGNAKLSRHYNTR